jgi:hypothetical protein
MIETEYSSVSNEIMKHHSTEELEQEDDRIISLNDCLCKFHDVERLSEKL